MANYEGNPAVSADEQFDAEDLDRRHIYNDHRAAVIAVGGPGMALGMWVGNGDYAYFSDEARDRAGRQALEALDVALAEMHGVRDRLAAAVEQDARKAECKELTR